MKIQDFFIPFSFGDPAGIVFFARSFDIYHESLEKNLKQSELWKEWFQNKDTIAPIVQCESQFFAPVYTGQNYQSTLELKKLGETSVSLTCTLSLNDKKCFQVQATHAFRNKEDFSKTRPSSKLIQWLKEL